MTIGIAVFAQKAATDTAQRGRMALSVLGHPTGLGTVRTGIVADGGGVVSAVGGSSMNVSVTPFRGMAQGVAGLSQGMYLFVMDVATTVTIPNTGGSSVTYRIALKIRDNAFDSSGGQDGTLIAYDIAGALPAGTLVPLRDVVVPASTSSGSGGITTGMLSTDQRKFVVANGGVQPVVDATALALLFVPSSGVRVVGRLDTGMLEYAVGTGGWQTIQPEITQGSAVVALLNSGVGGANVWIQGSGTGGPMTVQRWGEFVVLKGAIKNTVSPTAAAYSWLVGNLDAGYRPSSKIVATARLTNYNKAYVEVDTNGDVTIHADTAVQVNDFLNFDISWIRA